MEERPEGAEGEIFDLLFKSAEIVNFAPKERKEYIKDMTTERDIKNQLAFAENKGKIEGIKQTARNLLKLKYEVEAISKATGLTIEEIRAL